MKFKFTMSDFFRLFVTGPSPTRAMGIASGCVRCRESQKTPPPCDGFGAGCLGMRTPSPEETER